MKFVNYESLNSPQKRNFPPREAIQLSEAIEKVRPILDAIKAEGRTAVLRYAHQFDGLQNGDMYVSPAEFAEAEEVLDDNTKEALRTAYKNIHAFHRRQMPQSISVTTMQGVTCEKEYRAIESVGLYIPGGTAPLPSTMLMLGIPAKIAGCKRIIACTPAKELVHPAVLFAARLAGVTELLKIGGAQAIAFMAYGDYTFQKVSKIFGPGNQYVMAAKQLVSIDPAGCTIDMPAGPSEVMVIADRYANPVYIAADLLAQAEHGTDSQAVLVSDNMQLITAVNNQIAMQLEKLPRKAFAQESIKNSYSIFVQLLEQAFDISNEYAPEHLILHVENPERYKSKIVNAGSVFLGQYSPESVGDYASGTNHSLPTSGYAKSMGGVAVESFMKSLTFQQLTYEGLKGIAPTVSTLADAEGLFGHKNAVTLRMKQ